jgi:hypothetical protein
VRVSWGQTAANRSWRRFCTSRFIFKGQLSINLGCVVLCGVIGGGDFERGVDKWRESVQFEGNLSYLV